MAEEEKTGDNLAGTKVAATTAAVGTAVAVSTGIAAGLGGALMTGGVSLVVVGIGYLIDSLFSKDIPQLTLTVNFDDYDPWCGKDDTYNHCIKMSSRSMKAARYFCNTNWEEYYAGKLQEFLDMDDVKKMLGLIPKSIEAIKTKSLDGNEDKIDYLVVQESLMEKFTTEQLTSMTSEVLYIEVDKLLAEQYPVYYTSSQLRTWGDNLLTYNDVIAKLAEGWISLATSYNNFQTMSDAFDQLIGSGAWYEVNSAEDSVRGRKNTKFNDMQADEKLIPWINEGLKGVSKMRSYYAQLTRFIATAQRARTRVLINVFDNGKTGALNSKYAKIIDDLNDAHIAAITKLETEWQERFDAQAAKYDKALADMKSEYERVIKGLNATIEGYKKALKKSNDLLVGFSNKLDGYQADEVERLVNERMSLGRQAGAASEAAETVSAKEYKIANYNVNATEVNAINLAREAEEKQKQDLLDASKNKKTLIVAGGIGAVAIAGLLMFKKNNAGVPANQPAYAGAVMPQQPYAQGPVPLVGQAVPAVTPIQGV